MSPTPVRPPGTTLHLYRHLLREAGYLPPPCQLYFAGRIKAQFRQHRRDPAPRRRLQKAHHELRYLRAANLGDLTRMKKVVLLAFGRVGRRRRELFARLVRKVAPARPETGTTEEVAGAEADAYIDGTAGVMSEHDDWLDKWDTAKLAVFAKSQANQGARVTIGPGIKSAQLNFEARIPPLSAWGRPWHPRTLRTKNKKLWVAVAARVLPPLPRAEWEMLEGLAVGRLSGPEWKPPPRRVAAKAARDAEGEEHAAAAAATAAAWDWRPWAKMPASFIERKNSRRFRATNTVPEEAGEEAFKAAIGTRNFTWRLWRRLYAFVWENSATFTEHDGNGKARYVWGQMPKRVSQPAAAQEEFFHGITNSGTLPKRARGPKPSATGYVTERLKRTVRNAQRREPAAAT